MKGKKFLTLSLTVALLAGSALSVSAAGVADVFDANYYASKYSDLQAAFGNDAAALMKHFVTSGAKEGRVMSPILDVAAYRAAYKDLDAAFGDNWDAYVDHYLAFGIREGRKEGVLFDLVDYANQNPDVKAAYGDDYAAIAKHYVNYGIKEGRPGGQIVKQAAAATSSSSSSNSNASSGNSGTTTTPTTPPVVAYGHQHNWDAMIGTTAAEVVEFERPTCEHAGYINYRCTELVTCIWYTDGSAEWMLTDEIPDGAFAGLGDVVVKFHGKDVDWINVSQCSATSGRRTVAQLHHTVPTDGAYIVDHPTCTQAGVASYVCETCGKYVDKEAIPALGHAWANTKVVTATSCDEAGKGYTEQTCGRCGIKQQINVNYKHSYEKYAQTVAPTCHSFGEEVAYCNICKEKDTRKVGMLDHNPETVNVSVDTYVTDAQGNASPAHRTYQVTYCKNADCKIIRNVDDTAASVACTDNGQGICVDCGRPVNRAIVNAEKLYKVDEEFKPLANNIIQ